MSTPTQRATNMARHGIELLSAQIAEFCRHYHIRKLALFGSILRDDSGRGQ